VTIYDLDMLLKYLEKAALLEWFSTFLAANSNLSTKHFNMGDFLDYPVTQRCPNEEKNFLLCGFFSTHHGYLTLRS